MYFCSKEECQLPTQRPNAHSVHSSALKITWENRRLQIIMCNSWRCSSLVQQYLMDLPGTSQNVWTLYCGYPVQWHIAWNITAAFIEFFQRPTVREFHVQFHYVHHKLASKFSPVLLAFSNLLSHWNHCEVCFRAQKFAKMRLLSGLCPTPCSGAEGASP